MSEQKIVNVPLLVCVFAKDHKPEDVPYKIFNLRIAEQFISAQGLIDITGFATESFEAFKKEHAGETVRLLMALNDDWKAVFLTTKKEAEFEEAI